MCVGQARKNERRKVRNVDTIANERMRVAITPRERAAAENRAAQQRRRDARVHYERSMCSRHRLYEINLLGASLRFDSTVYMLCCSCLGVMTLEQAHWRAEALVCSRCLTRLQAMAAVNTLATTAAAVTNRAAAPRTLHAIAPPLQASLRCRRCGHYARAGDAYMALTVYNDLDVGNERFVTIHLCPTHAVQNAWISASSNIMSLSAVDCGLRSKWSQRSGFDPSVDYLPAYVRACLGGADEAGEDALKADGE